MRKTALSLAAALLLLWHPPVALGRPDTSQTRLTLEFRTRYFRVKADPSDPYLARLTARGATEHLQRVAQALGLLLDPDKPFTLCVYRTHMDFIKAGGLHTRKFTVGTAASDDTISVDASGAFEPADRILAHEVTHAVIFRILGANAPYLPLWLNEGLAKLESDGSDELDRSLVSNAAADDRLIPLQQLRGSFPADRTELAYAQSFLVVKEIAERYGKAVFRNVLSEMARGNSFDDAMEKAVGVSGEEFEREWNRLIGRRYRAARMVRSGAAVVSFTMAVLAVAAFVVRRRQKIAAARRWEREEMDNVARRLLGGEPHP